MNLRDPKTWIAVLSAMAVGVLAARDLAATSPGELSAAHGRDPDLNSRRGCAQCHGSRGVPLAQACLECHEDVGADIEHGTGLHGTFEGILPQQCALCHGEHHGADFRLVNKRSFAIAGVPDVDAFDHEMIGFAMEGKHTELECTECHEHAHVDVVPEGARRFLGLDQDCATCHDDPHEGRMARACAGCHGQEDFVALETFAHDERFPLFGRHAEPACADCHAAESAHSVEASADRDGPPRWRECADCHESPHVATLHVGVAALVGGAPGDSCLACHEIDHAHFRDETIEVTPDLHAAAGFSLDAPHDRAACDDCHSPHAPRFDLRYPGRGPDECSACHEDVHGGQFDGGVFAGGCLVCHTRHEFEPHAFGLDQHALTAFALDGAHASAECRACHEVELEGAPRTFHGTERRCEACHTDAHEGFFDGFGAELAALDEGTCAACHDARSFALADPTTFDHAAWTGFALDGAHAQSACESCHQPADVADEFGRTFGRVREHFGAVEGCVTCHRDPHGGRFDRPDLPRELEGRQECARCHNTSSFRDVADTFDHSVWTGYPLTGGHRELGCAACHRPVPGGDQDGRTFERAVGRDCQDCHADPHLGQLDVQGQPDCARCHVTTHSWADLAFDHERDTRFPLGEAHRDLACARCHEPWPLENGGAVVRYRPLDHECRDCHGVNADQLEKLLEGGDR